MMTWDRKVRHNTHDAGYVEQYAEPDSGMLVAVAVVPRLPADGLTRGKPVRAHGGLALSEIGMETPGEDAAEQAREVPEEEAGELRELPFEVDEADAAEQVRDVGYDDEDYR
jgi:hypothetical protein